MLNLLLYVVFERRQRRFSGLGLLEPQNLAVGPATLPLCYSLKPKSLARRVFDIQVSFLFSDVEAPERSVGRTAHFNPEVHPNLLGG